MTIDDSLSIQQAIQQALGFAPPLNRIETSSSYRRFDTEKKNRLNGFFRVSEHKGSLSCHFGDWSRGISLTWTDRNLTESKLSDLCG